jgi:YegS/Rv2252/BmrU family lipid kinase
VRRPALETRIRSERRAALVVDARARGGKTALPAARALLETAGVTVTSAVAAEDQAALLAAVDDAVADGEPLVVIGGGDGTLRAIVGAFAYRETALAILPLGTANNFARSLGIPVRLADAVGVAVHGKVAAVDLARIDGEVFANVAVLGFPRGVARAAPPGAKRRLGPMAYVLYETPYLLSQTLFSATISTPSETRTFRTRQLIIANGSHYGTRRLAPDARVDDGLLDILAIASTSRWQGLSFWLRYPFGRHLRMRGFRRIRGGRAVIETDPPVPSIIGGEPGPTTPFTVTVDPGARAVMVPVSFAECRPGP